MRVYLKDLTAKEKDGILSILNGAGFSGNDAVINKDGDTFILEVEVDGEVQLITVTPDML